MTRFKFSKKEVKYNDFLKDSKETEIRDSILSSGIVDTIKTDPGSLEFYTDSSIKDDKSLDNRIINSLTESFYSNISQDAARQTIKDYDLIHQVIKDDPGLSSYYNQYNNLKSESKLLDKQLKSFTYTHEDLWYHGFEDNSITLEEYDKRRDKYAKDAEKLKNQAQQKFNYIMKVLTREGADPTAARWFYKMYNTSGGTIMPDNFLYANPEVHEKLMGNWDFKIWNPFTWDLWDPRKWDNDLHEGVTNIMGPSINRKTGELQWKDTFMPAGQFPGGDNAKAHYSYVTRNMDEATLKVFNDFMMIHGDYEKITEDFNNFNQMMGNVGNEGLQVNIPSVDFSGGYGSVYFALLHDKEGVDISGGTLTIEPSQKNAAYKIAQDYDENRKQINNLKSEANLYIKDALNVDIDKESISLGLLYTFEELLDEMDKSFDKTKSYYVDEIGLDPKLVDLWYQNLKAGNFSDINK
tara:strand:+ start:3669 stop:5066 length:1398 start_codon:yes stop_codon:yes gene_type:complete